MVDFEELYRLTQENNAMLRDIGVRAQGAG